ncbi:MAG: glycosyltransferase family 2 protein [Hyphomicrobiales bacterium]
MDKSAVESQPDTVSHASVEGLSATVVVPVYNERESLRDLTKAIQEVALQSPEIASIEIVLVDDGSTDDSWSTLADIANRDPNVTAIRLRRNFGKATALDVGLRQANTDIVITMDADLQDDPREIPNFLTKIQQGYDVVSGWKVERQDRASKVLPSKLFNLVTALLTGVKLKDINCGFRPIGERFSI